MKRTISYLILFWMLPGGSGALALRAAAPLRIGVAVFPLKDMVEKIAGDQAVVFCAIPAGANPHVYEPTPSVVRQVQSLDLFFGVAPGFDGWVARFLNKNAQHVYLQDKDFGANPHIWLSLRNALLIIQKISGQLARLRPEKKAYFESNRDQFAGELARLDKQIGSLFLFLPNRKLFLWHPSWNYFAADYNLEIAGVIESGHGDEPSVRDFQKLVQNARSGNVRVVVVDLNVESRAAAALVRQIGGVLLRLDALGDPRDPERSDYIGLMHWNARRLAQALREYPSVKALSPR